MPKNPKSGNPDIFVHGRGNGTDHPAVPVAAADFTAYSHGLGTVPKIIPALGSVEVSHDLFIFGAVTGHDIPVRIDKKGVESHVAGKETLLAVNIVD